MYTVGNLELLTSISRQIKTNELEEVSEATLKKNTENDSITFYINKQAACHNKFHIIDEDMSPLGDIQVTIKTDNPEQVIEWIIS